MVNENLVDEFDAEAGPVSAVRLRPEDGGGGSVRRKGSQCFGVAAAREIFGGQIQVRGENLDPKPHVPDIITWNAQPAPVIEFKLFGFGSNFIGENHGNGKVVIYLQKHLMTRR